MVAHAFTCVNLIVAFGAAVANDVNFSSAVEAGSTSLNVSEAPAAHAAGVDLAFPNVTFGSGKADNVENKFGSTSFDKTGPPPRNLEFLGKATEADDNVTLLSRGTPQCGQRRRRFGFDRPLLPGEGEFWELVKSSDVQDVLPTMKRRDDTPQCMQGLVWMDQQCKTYWKMPWSYKCRALWGILNANEYLTGFESWDARSKCFAFARDAWTFGQHDIAYSVCKPKSPIFCQTNSRTHAPCDEGARFQGPGEYALMKTSFGWDRITSDKWGTYHYPVLPVVDKYDQKTEWFDEYLDEVTRKSCPLSQPKCRKSEWASSGYTARCLCAAR